MPRKKIEPEEPLQETAELNPEMTIVNGNIVQS